MRNCLGPDVPMGNDIHYLGNEIDILADVASTAFNPCMSNILIHHHSSPVSRTASRARGRSYCTSSWLIPRNIYERMFVELYIFVKYIGGFGRLASSQPFALVEARQKNDSTIALCRAVNASHQGDSIFRG